MQLWIIRIDTTMYVSRKYHLCISIKNSLQRHIRLRCYLKWIKNSIDCNAIELLTCLCILPTLTEMKNDQINMSWAKKFIKIVEFELNDIKMFQNIYVYSKCAKTHFQVFIFHASACAYKRYDLRYPNVESLWRQCISGQWQQPKGTANKIMHKG